MKILANQRDLAFIRSLDLSAEDRAMILGGNLAGLLGIHLE
jgi:hypothetical protein